MSNVMDLQQAIHWCFFFRGKSHLYFFLFHITNLMYIISYILSPQTGPFPRLITGLTRLRIKIKFNNFNNSLSCVTVANRFGIINRQHI